MAAGGAKGVTVENVPGAGGTVGLAQLIDQEKGKPNVLMVNGLVMIGAILTNQSPVNLSMTTPIARLTGEYEVIVVPAASEIKTLADLAAKIKADAGSVAIGGGSAGGTDHILAGLVVKDQQRSGPPDAGDPKAAAAPGVDGRRLAHQGCEAAPSLIGVASSSPRLTPHSRMIGAPT